LLRILAFVVAVLISLAHCAPAQAQQPAPDTVIKWLQEGNKRYVSGTNRTLVRSADRPTALNKMQAPFAMILGCADSRVTPELAFDQPWGTLFTVRVAGNIAEPYMVGSLEYAILTFKTPVIVVLGHDNCGAVDAAMAGAQVTGNLKKVVDDITPAVQGAKNLGAGIDANVRHAMQQLQSSSPVVAEAVKAGRVRIIGAVYTFKTGGVRWVK
jgi:carbonic anhydrase